MSSLVGGGLWLAVSPPQPAQGAFPGRNGVIAYVVSDVMADDVEIDFAPPFGGRLPGWAGRLDGLFAQALAFSPDGRWFAYTSVETNSRIVAQSIHSKRRRVLTHPPGDASDSEPSWSPQGTRVAFTRSARSDTIYTVDTGGDRLRKLTRGAQPAWSSRGLIAFERGRDIWETSTHGRLRQLTRGRAHDDGPDWSPSGRSIVFSRDGDLFVMRRGGRSLRRLTSGGATDDGPVFSPDGHWIAFDREVGDCNAGDGCVAVMPVTGGAPRLLPDNPCCGAELIYSPDWQALPRRAP